MARGGSAACISALHQLLITADTINELVGGNDIYSKQEGSIIAVYKDSPPSPPPRIGYLGEKKNTAIVVHGTHNSSFCPFVHEASKTKAALRRTHTFASGTRMLFFANDHQR